MGTGFERNDSEASHFSILQDCFAVEQSTVPSSHTNPMSINVAEEYSQLLMFGSFVHGIGIIGDGSFAARVYVKRTEWFRFGSLIAVSFYSLCFTGWFVYLHMQVFKHESYVCSGHYLSADELKEPTEKYAIKQGRIMQNI